MLNVHSCIMHWTKYEFQDIAQCTHEEKKERNILIYDTFDLIWLIILICLYLCISTYLYSQYHTVCVILAILPLPVLELASIEMARNWSICKEYIIKMMHGV